MPYYDYMCEKCGNEFELNLKIADRHIPTETPCEEQGCGGKISIKVGLTGFAYDNISSPGHKKSTPLWMKHKLQEIKRTQPGATMNIPE